MAEFMTDQFFTAMSNKCFYVEEVHDEYRYWIGKYQPIENEE